MTIDRLINLLAAMTLIEMMISIGLGVRWSEIVLLGRAWNVIGRALLANYVLVPAAAVALLAWFHPKPMVAVAFLVVAVCPGAPYGPPFTAVAKGNVSLAVGLMVLLAGSSALLAPLLLGLLLPLATRSSAVEINVARLVGTLLGAQLFPLSVGLLVRTRQPSLAERLQRPARFVSVSLNLLTLAVILFAQGRMLSQIHIKGYLGMSSLLTASMVAGWVVDRHGQNAKGLILTTAVRNVGVALVIASASFPGTAAISSTIAYALFQTIIIALVAFIWGRLTPTTTLLHKRAA